MPGLSALQKLNADLLNLGDEVKIRSARGEKPVTVPIPQDFVDIDDADDFKFGMPALSEEEQAQADAAAKEKERAANDFSDITGESDEGEETVTAKTPESAVPDLSNLLLTESFIDDSLDLSAFEDDEPEEEVPPEPEEIPIEDMDLAALLAPKADPEPEPEPVPVKPQPAPARQNASASNMKPGKPAAPKTEIPVSKPEPVKNPMADFDFEGLDASLFDDIKPAAEETKVPETSAFDVPDLPGMGASDPFAVPDLPGLEDELKDVTASADDLFAQPEAFEELTEELPAEELPAEESFEMDSIAGIKVEKDDTKLAAPKTPAMSDEELFSSYDSLTSDFDDAPDSELIDLNLDIPIEFNEIPDNPGAPEEVPDFIKEKQEAATPKEEVKKTAETPTEEISLDDFDSFDSPSAGSEDFSDNLDLTEAESETDFTAEVPSFDDANVSTDSSTADDFNFGDTSGLDDDSFDSAGVSAEGFDFDNITDSSSETAGTEATPDFDFGNTLGLDDELPDFGADGTADFGATDFGASFNAAAGLDGFPQTEEAPSEETPAADSVADDSFNFNIPSDSSTSDSFETDVTDDFFSDGGTGDVPSPDDVIDDSFGTDFSAGMDDEPAETFDTSDINGLDFSNDTGSDSGMDDFSFGSEGDDIFNIPGFSDTSSADLEKKNKPKVQAPDFSKAVQASDKLKAKNTFTDAEYERFNANLNTYPLNVKIALEDLIVKNELTDDALFEILEKVLRKVPARTLASELEKVTDQTLEVPKDFERRSAEEYEAYKKSLEYQLKNKIIPGALITTFAAAFIACLFILFNTFIYKPAMANSLYKQGYNLIQEELYPQSEEKFNKALTYKPKKNWFYKYAESYGDHKQYDRARMMYNAILKRYKHDKSAGLLWAKMESNELYNYEEAERILKREVLDYHINDSEAILQLGDLYLDWATELDPEKYSLAKVQYDLLFSLYGAKDEYLAREMRYFIRTDNLRQVLTYKDIFYPKKRALSSEDLTELSGFLLDKRYGKLRASEENLRFNIENVRELLERALKADATNPIANYNMGRYFVETNNSKGAVYYLKNTINLFNAQNIRNKRDTYKFINSYRLLGEEYRDQKEYLLAQENYTNGIELFEQERESSGFESTEQIGKIYADLADLDYFISSDNDVALANYINAVNNKYDTASVRYRIGYIQYQKENYSAALGSFIRSHDSNPGDMNLLLALANTLSMNNDSYVSKGYYERLIEILNAERERNKILYSKVTDSQIEVIDLYMRAANNLGVTLNRIANQTGNSAMNAQAIVQLQESLRAWDALTRNPETMVRLDGSNLAEQNVKYITNPLAEYEPQIYTEIKRTLHGEKALE